MISPYATFWILISCYALVGGWRGWRKEVIAMSGLILSLFTISQFGWLLVNLLGNTSNENGTNPLTVMMQSQFYILSTFYVIIAFFSYQWVYLADRRLLRRLRIRRQLQERISGALAGAINGYLIVGAFWSFLEYQITSGGFVQLQASFPYPFNGSIVRPMVAASTSVQMLLNNLPLPLLVPYLPFLVVIVFLMVIIVMI